MKIKPVGEAKTHLNALIAPGQSEPVLITRNGKPAAVLVPVPEDSDVEDLTLSFSPRFWQIIDASRERFARGEGIPLAELRSQFEAARKPDARGRARANDASGGHSRAQRVGHSGVSGPPRKKL
jgi:prevent-host-death family protein